jgi:ubiquinone/menaquinone biosynthesis C-methylase UbiE
MNTTTVPNQEVRRYWEARPCGTGQAVTAGASAHSKEWFERVENHRYAMEPFIHAVAQFTRYYGQKVLEIGVGAGTDHLQWARAGADCFGVDLTDAAIAITAERLALYGLRSTLQRLDAETLPFPDAIFDVVYSWGVIHHAEHPDAVLAEAHRVLKPGGVLIGMLYGRRSMVALKAWLRHALLKGRPWRSLSDVICHHVESVGTKAYTPKEIRSLLSGFEAVELIRYITPYDTSHLPRAVSACLPNAVGWNICFRAIR